MSGVVTKIGILAPNAKRMNYFLEKRILANQYELCVIDYDETELPNQQSMLANKDLHHKLDCMDILIADTKLIYPFLKLLKNVKWVQLIWAGVEGMFTKELAECPPTFPVTRFGGVLGHHMAEYTISNIINCERNAFKFHDNQKEKHWSSYNSVEYRLLSELKITILGCGDIGRLIAKHCKQFGATVYGMVNTKRNENDDCVDEYFTSSDLTTFLQRSDYVCNVLPSTPSTKNFLTADLLQHCQDTVFINIGRGDVIKEEVLLHALQKKWLRAVILDVFEKEPLPKDSKLWTCPNVHITPHVSGATKPHHVADVFMKQLKLFEKNEPLNFCIDWKRGY